MSSNDKPTVLLGSPTSSQDKPTVPQEITCEEARAFFKGVRCIYTDLDGTLFSPGSSITCNHANEPCSDAVSAMVSLQKAGIKLIANTGRDIPRNLNLARLLNLDGYIGELGATMRDDMGVDGKTEYFLGDWDVDTSDPDTDLYSLIDASGVVDALFEAFPGKLSFHRQNRQLHHEIIHLFRGMIDMDVAQQIIDQGPIPLTLIDNGPIANYSPDIVREVTRELGAENLEGIRVYHLIPRGVSKGVTLQRHAERHGYTTEQTLGVGDAMADVANG